MAKRKVKQPWHKGQYDTQSRKLNAASRANPETRCWRCGGLTRPGDPWTSGHLVDGQVGGALAPEHRSCNSRAGRLLRARRERARRIRRTDLTW